MSTAQPQQSKMPAMEVISKFHFTKEQIINEELVINVAKADPKKFEILYNKYHEQIFRFIYQRVDDKDTAHDITQNVFLKAMLNLKKYEHKGVPFASWLYRIARTTFNDFYKENSKIHAVNIDDSDVSDMVEEMKEDKMEQYSVVLPDAIAKLPDDDLEMVEMRFFEKRSFKEIGEILNITENNAKVRMYRILDKLKKTMTNK